MIGLSPRVRGSHGSCDVVHLGLRSIPASAGQPDIEGPVDALLKVYPRECGAAALNRVLRLVATGLSPRVRGSHRTLAISAHPTRSIPASAGQPLGVLI